MAGRVGYIRPATLVLLLSLLMVGCGVDGDGPGSATSSGPTTATTGEATAGPTASPGVDFLYQTRVDDGLGVFVSSAGKVTRVDQAAPGSRHKHPIWTNDGSRAAFVAEGTWDAAGTVTRRSEIWVVGPAGEDPQALIRCTCWDLNNPAWSPDGTKVAFAEFDAPLGNGPPAKSRIIALDLSTEQRTTVASSQPGQLLDIPRWSPDGSRLVVSIDRFDASGNETGSSFGVVPLTGGSVKPILPFEEFAYAADWGWATDTLVFSVESQEFAAPDHKPTRWNLFIINPDGSNRRALTNVGPGEGFSLPMWSADGSLIAATMDTTLDAPGGQMAVVVDPATGTMTPLADPVSDYARVRPPQQ